MKKTKGKKLHLKKVDVAKLNGNDMHLIKGGRKSGEPTCNGEDDVIPYSKDRRCRTQQVNCTSPTVIGF